MSIKHPISRLLQLAGIAGISAVSALCLTACSGARRASAPPIAKQDRLPLPTIAPGLKGTVESVATLAYNSPILVRGWGVVAGLPNTGSGEMPPEIRHIMMNRLLKNGVGFRSENTGQYDPRQILSSRQISAVDVEGIIPALATRGTTFDLYIAALPGSQTTSLENGLLWPLPLRVHLRRAFQSTPIAHGRGPVFCDPFSKSGHLLKPTDLTRNGRIIGGGVVTADLPVLLQLYTPSFRIAALVERIINERYGSFPPAATAENDVLISLHVPNKYRHDPARFVNLVLHLSLQQDIPGFTQHQAVVLIHDLHNPIAPHRQLAMALRQLGRTIIPILRQHYASTSVSTSFYCLQAGTLLGDQEAIVRMVKIADDPASAFQTSAVHALERCRDHINATLAFTRLLTMPQPAMRIMGYRALRRIHSGLIYSQIVGGKFTLDVLPTNQPAIVYVTTTGHQRIAVIGKVPSLVPGSLYISPANTVIINYSLSTATKPAAADAPEPAQAPASGVKKGLFSNAMKLSPPTSRPAVEPVELYYRGPLTGRTVKLSCGTQLPGLIIALGSAPNPFSPKFDPRKPYIALSYQRLIVMLYKLCKQQELPAIFHIQKISHRRRDLYATLNQPRTDGTAPAATQPAGGNAPSNGVSPFNTQLPGEISHPPTGSSGGTRG